MTDARCPDRAIDLLREAEQMIGRLTFIATVARDRDPSQSVARDIQATVVEARDLRTRSRDLLGEE